ncbi:MAG TPA: alpha/beta hydrolase [Syntrophales bacterium]|nr:alpha/beta hydrolase [Syntrophales bacterium]
MRKQPEDRFIGTDNLRLHYLDWGSDKARTMVLLHGIGDTAHVWDDFSRDASDRLRIIALDQRGHGLSNWVVPPAYRCDDYVADLDRLVESLRLTGVILMGHSMGALHATRYASLRPDRVSGLIHCDIEPRPPAWNRKYLLNLYETLPAHYESIDEYVSEARQNSPYADEETLYRIASTSLARGDDGRYRTRFDREVLSLFDAYDLRPCLGNIRCPSLVIRGEESRVMDKKVAVEMSTAIPQGRFREIPRAAHPVHTDNPVEFHRAVFEFLDDLTASFK